MMRAASKGKTAKKKTKGEEGKLLMIYSFIEYCFNVIRSNEK